MMYVNMSSPWIQVLSWVSICIMIHKGSCQERYGIIMSKYGCPDTQHMIWATGYVHLKSISPSTTFSWSKDSNLHGLRAPENIKLSFCSQTLDTDSSASNDIPGTYCVFKMSDQCPQGKILLFPTYKLSYPSINSSYKYFLGAYQKVG